MIILACEGTWAKEPWGFLGDVVNRLPFPVERINYPEQYGDAFSYNESVYIGKRALRRRVSQITEPFCIISYSQGAHIAGDVALENRYNDYLKGVYLIADPKRSVRDRLIGPDPGGHGIFGGRPIGPKAIHFAAKGDIITANRNPFISNVAFYTLEKKQLGRREWFKTFKAARSQRLPGGKVFDAIKDVKFYLGAQVHTRYNSYVVEDGLTVPEWIARDINHMIELSV